MNGNCWLDSSLDIFFGRKLEVRCMNVNFGDFRILRLLVIWSVLRLKLCSKLYLCVCSMWVYLCLCVYVLRYEIGIGVTFKLADIQHTVNKYVFFIDLTSLYKQATSKVLFFTQQ